jgi:hypothetical protein
MAVQFKDTPLLWNRVAERLALTMDLLLIYDRRSDLTMAAACMDSINWQLREAQSKDVVTTEGGIDIFTYNYWRNSLVNLTELKSDLKMACSAHMDLECRKNVANFWVSYRLDYGKKEFNAKNKPQVFLKLLMAYFNSVALGRNTLYENKDRWLKNMVVDESFISPVVLKSPPLPRGIEICDGARAEPSTSEKLLLDRIKSLLKEAERVLCAVQVSHDDRLNQGIELFIVPYEKLIDTLFDLCEELRCSNAEQRCLVAHILCYQYLKTYLKTYNVFERVQIERPEGTYTEVKYSPYFQSLFLRWRLSQSLTLVYQKCLKRNTQKLDLDSADSFQLYVLLAQLYGWIVDETTQFVFGFTVLRDFWATKNKLDFLKSLSHKQKEVIDVYNRVSLIIYGNQQLFPLLRMLTAWSH